MYHTPLHAIGLTGWKLPKVGGLAVLPRMGGIAAAALKMQRVPIRDCA